MQMEYRQLLLSELRLAVLEGEEIPLSDTALCKAMTVNENLKALGYTLRPKDIVRLSCSQEQDSFYAEFSTLIGDVKAAPMYPDFPSQVMEMDEAEFRFHQLLHYYSTYGLEQLFGKSVHRGWLPDGEGTAKTETDTVLFRAKTIELITPDLAFQEPLARILARRERMTDKECRIAALALPHMDPQMLASLSIPFKENRIGIFYLIFCHEELDRLPLLHAVCQHTGDVLRCMDYTLTRCGYHFRTSQKRLLVQLLESYPAKDLETNLILSRKKARRSLLMLQYVDYNAYSRSPEHRAAVFALRSGRLRSWESRVKHLLSTDREGALPFIAARPGMLLRMTAWLVRMGEDPDRIRRHLLENAEALSTQTLATVLTHFGRKQENAQKQQERETVYSILEPVLAEKLRRMETPLRGKRVYVDMGEFDLVHSTLQCNNKSAEGGYVRSGIAYRIPKNVRLLRFFVYWNDAERVDVDLHASAKGSHGEDIFVGWNGKSRAYGIVHSGDITHSDAAEYIDINLENPLDKVFANITLYSGKPCFGDIAECYVGMMAVDKLGQNVKLYSSANCFFSHYLTGDYRRIHYGYIDVVNRCLVFDGSMGDGDYSGEDHAPTRMNLDAYLTLLIRGQGAALVSSKEESDITLVMGKPMGEEQISFIDHNFFLDA